MSRTKNSTENALADYLLNKHHGEIDTLWDAVGKLHEFLLDKKQATIASQVFDLTSRTEPLLKEEGQFVEGYLSAMNKDAQYNIALHSGLAHLSALSKDLKGKLHHSIGEFFKDSQPPMGKKC